MSIQEMLQKIQLQNNVLFNPIIFGQFLQCHVQSMYNAVQNLNHFQDLHFPCSVSSDPNSAEQCRHLRKTTNNKRSCKEDEEAMDETNLSSRLILQPIGKHLHKNHNHHKVKNNVLSLLNGAARLTRTLGTPIRRLWQGTSAGPGPENAHRICSQ